MDELEEYWYDGSGNTNHTHVALLLPYHAKLPADPREDSVLSGSDSDTSETDDTDESDSDSYDDDTDSD